MPKFRKRPVVVDAVEVATVLRLARDDWHALPDWVRDAYEAATLLFLPDFIEVKTLNGWVKASRYDWLMRGVNGEIYPCRGDIFVATYEPVEE